MQDMALGFRKRDDHSGPAVEVEGTESLLTCVAWPLLASLEWELGHEQVWLKPGLLWQWGLRVLSPPAETRRKGRSGTTQLK